MLSSFRHVLSLVELRRSLLIRFAASSLGRSLLSLATILLIKEFLGGVLGDAGGLAGEFASSWGTTAALYLVAAALFLSFAGSAILQYDNQVTQQRMVKVLELSLMNRVLRHVLGMSVGFFDRQSHGDILQALRQDVTEIRATVFSLGKLVFDGVTAVGLFVAALWLSPRLTFWSLLVLPLAAIPVMLLARRALHRSREVRTTGYVFFDAILQMLRGIRVIKVFGGEEREAEAAMVKGTRYFDELIAMVRIQSLANVLLSLLASLGIVLVIVIGGFDVMAGRLDWPSLLAFLFAVRALHGPLNSMNQAAVSLGAHGASAERVSGLLKTMPLVAESPEAVPMTEPIREVAFNQVGFAYHDRPILSDISFEVRAGETIGIVGPSGTGKTTLLNLVARFHDPTSGIITFNGRDLREFRLADVYSGLAVVLQEPILFAATVRENIRAGKPEASDAEVEQAARSAGVHHEILLMPSGYDTVVGLGGVGVSGGQAQRLNIARALLKNPPLLLLDEATSALDSIAEGKVQDALDRLMEGRTTFVVAHRLSTLRGASRILVLNHGRVAGFGPHAELLESCDVYRTMWELQTVVGSPGGREAEVVSVAPPELELPGSGG